MSGRKNNLPSYKVVTDGSMAASITSSPTNIAYLDNVGIQCDVSGSPTGVLSVQVSNNHQEDVNGNVTVQGTFVPLQQADGTPVQAAITAGSPSPVFFDLNQLSATYIRTVYTRSSGTGVLNVVISAKML